MVNILLTSDLFVHIFVVDHFISGGWAAVPAM